MSFLTGGKLFVYVRECQLLKDVIPLSQYHIRDCLPTVPCCVLHTLQTHVLTFLVI